jgi:2-polyprenyl-6-methoxyphenol hydroxylase-like FAD-dependent oxidoreductase
MTICLVGVQGHFAGRRCLSDGPLTLGRGTTNDVVLADPAASRVHAELRPDGDGCLLIDLGSGNGTFVNGTQVSMHRLRPGDQIRIGADVFRFDVVDSPTVLLQKPPADAAASAPPVLKVTIAGGGPVGMSFALMLDQLMGPRVAITIHEGRWTTDGDRFVWQNPEQGNNRRQQVVTVQSRQFLKLPAEIQARLFQPGTFTEMWPAGPDSIQDYPPRNIRISFIEDELLAILNEKTDHIRLVAENFDVAHADLSGQQVLAICEGGKSPTREHFAGRFGTADQSVYGLEGAQVSDMVLGLRVKSRLPDPMSVLLTVTQNRFLLNSLRGEGFLNMRLTDQEALEAVGINPVRQMFTPCIQSTPCLLERLPSGEYHCEGHHAFFLPALLKGSALWERVQEGLRMFDVPEADLTAVTGFRLDMVQRPRFTAEVLPRTASSPATYGFLLGDAANAIHFWPGRGLNSGLASATSLARCLATSWTGTPFRDSAFTRHEAVMAALQYRHKTRAFRQMVTTDHDGTAVAIKDLIARGITEGEQGASDRARDLDLLLQRLRNNRTRLAPRLAGVPDDDALRPHLERLSAQTLHTLVVSEPWDSGNVGGEEVDVDWLLPEPEAGVIPAPRRAGEVAAARGWSPIVV